LKKKSAGKKITANRWHQYNQIVTKYLEQALPFIDKQKNQKQFREVSYANKRAVSFIPYPVLIIFKHLF